MQALDTLLFALFLISLIVATFLLKKNVKNRRKKTNNNSLKYHAMTDANSDKVQEPTAYEHASKASNSLDNDKKIDN